MHPITLLQNTPVEDIKHFCEANNYALTITGTGDLILTPQPRQWNHKLNPVRTVEYITMSIGALTDIVRVANIGGTVEITKATDGTDIILAKTPQGHTRILPIKLASAQE